MTTALEHQHPTEADAPQRDRRGGVAGVAAAVQFLTVMPSPMRRPFAPGELGQSVGWFPAVGLLIGGLLAGLNGCLERVFPASVTAALLLAAWVLFTGALHLDGFLDSCDGLFGGQSPEARLRIMRDERAGAFAVVGGVLLLLLKYAALAGNPDRLAALLVAPVVGRWGMAVAVVGFPYGRAEGLGRAMKDHAGRAQVLLATAVTAAVTAGIAVVAAGGWRALLAVPLAAAGTWAGGRFVLRRLPGLTGDIYGALCELLEAALLLLFVAGGSHAA
jgi:adenosylcobinamide-GDP ribazoletransferase